tara:strand:- start:482 stop:913 length:432 start_codon:yes stop_codon:yes gene_type:complete
MKAAQSPKKSSLLLASVPDGVDTARFVDLIGAFIAMRDPIRYNSDDPASNVYIAEVKENGSAKVAVVNIENMTAANQIMLKFFMNQYRPDKCVLCASALNHDSHDAVPIVQGECCGACNATMVVPFRESARLAGGQYGTIFDA